MMIKKWYIAAVLATAIIGSGTHKVEATTAAKAQKVLPLPKAKGKKKQRAHSSRGLQGTQGIQGIQGIQGPAGPVGFTAPLNLFVDAAAPLGGNGTLATPFKKIQDAINTIQPATDASSLEQSVTIHIASGIYNENPTIIVNSRRISLVALGDVILGNGIDTGLIRWVSTGPQFDNVRPSLLVSTINSIDATNTVTANRSSSPSIGTFHITRGVQVIGAPIFADLILNNVEVNGDVSFDDYVALNLFFYNSTFHGQISARSGLSQTISLQVADRCMFEKPIIVGSYQLIRSCSILNGMEVQTAPLLSANAGILDTFFSGTFSLNQTTTLLVDGYTNYWFDSAKGNTAQIGSRVTKKVLLSSAQ